MFGSSSLLTRASAYLPHIVICLTTSSKVHRSMGGEPRENALVIGYVMLID